MAGPAPNNRHWSARENAHKPKGLHVIVTGAVEVADADQQPVLTKASGDGKVLTADLSIGTCNDPAIDVKVWKHAFLHEEVSAGQYERVSIRWEGKQIANVEVIDDREHRAMAKKMADEIDAKHGRKKQAKKAKKAAKKKAKKAAPKKAKKAKKAGALKKLVRKLVKKLAPKKAKKKGGR